MNTNSLALPAHASRSPLRAMARSTLAALTAATALAACSPSPAAQAPRDIAEEVVQGLAAGDATVIDSYFDAAFVEHAAQGTSNLAALRARLAAQVAAHPQASAVVYRVMAEGELVFVHSNVILDPGTRGAAVADFFRFANGKIAERWSSTQDVPATTASGNDMFHTLSAPQRLDPDPDADAATTTAVMIALGTALAVDKDLNAWDRYAQAPYYQHNVNTPNGIEAVKQVWGPIITNPNVVITPVNHLTDHDLYVTTNKIDAPGMKFQTVDLSRIRGGKVVEHWDVVEFLP